MIQRFLALTKKDIINGYRNYFFVVTIFIAVFFGLIINFVVPEDTSIKPDIYIYNSYDGEYAGLMDGIIEGSQQKHSNMYMLKSRREVVESMKDNFNSIGLVILEKSGLPNMEFIMQGYENEKIVNTLILSMEDDIKKKIYGDINIDTIVLKQDMELADIPFNKSILPMFLVMEPVLLGFIMILALVFMEKDEGTIKAYMVSPGGVSEYLAAKIVFMIILGWISAVISTLMVVGVNADYIKLLSIVTVGGIFASGLGLIVSSFFDNLSKSMVWIMIVSILLSLPFISYFVPSFAPNYIRLIPTYSLLFAMKEAVFPTGNTAIIYNTLITFFILAVINYILALLAYRYNLSKM